MANDVFTIEHRTRASTEGMSRQGNDADFVSKGQKISTRIIFVIFTYVLVNHGGVFEVKATKGNMFMG